MLQRKFDIAVRTHFPNALDAKDTSIKYLGQLQRDHDIDISKVLMATSVCSDDLNVNSTSLFNVTFGPFNMGGLGGYPFAGLTGMAAFAHHVPDNGAALILYGPHVGITVDGELGVVNRPRMESPGHSCGALLGVLNVFQQEDYKWEGSEEDHQFSTLARELLPFRESIISSDNPVKKITECAFEIIHDKVKFVLDGKKDQFEVNKVVLLGGIIVNTDYGLDDYFDARHFEVIEL
jgi:hypothetical protein